MNGLNSTVKLFPHPVPVWIVLLVGIEFLLCVTAMYVGVNLRFGGDQNLIIYSVEGPVWGRAMLFAAMCVIGMIAMGLYQVRQEPRLSVNIGRIAVGMLLGATASTIIYYVLPQIFTGRGAFALSLGVAFTFVSMFRLLYYHIADNNLFKTRVLVVGAGKAAASIARLHAKGSREGFKVVGYMATGNEPPAKECADRVIQPGNLAEFVEQSRINEIVVAMDDRRNCFPARELLECRMSGVEISEVSSFVERETGKISLEVVSESWIIFSDGFRRGFFQQISERVFDLVASSLLLLIMSPALIIAAIAIWIESGGREPIFYGQPRVGYKGKVFELLKFRSMNVNAEADGKAKWATSNDPRVTFTGGIIRRFRIDELPQIINIFRGEMSFVGPRPERPQFVDMLADQIPYYRERHYVKPGLAGWAQIAYPYGASIDDARQKLQYDLYYIKNHSLIFDLLILLQTLDVVVWGRGSRMASYAHEGTESSTST